MKFSNKHFMLLLLAISLLSSYTFSQIYTTEKVDFKVKELLSKMTLEEKIGQMTQVTLQAVSKVPWDKRSNASD